MIQSFGQSHESYMPDVPVYGTIARTGRSWTVTMHEKTTTTGCTITGTSSGYGDFPFDKYPNIPVIDFTMETFERCFESLHIHDSIKPDKNLGTIEEFVQAHKDKGFKVI